MAAAAGEAIHSGDARFRATALVQRWSPFAAAAVRCWAAPLAFSLLLQSGQPHMHPSAQGGGGGRLGALSTRESPLLSRTRCSGYRGCCSPMRISHDAGIANAIWSLEMRIYVAPLRRRKRARWRSRDEANVALGTVVKLKTATSRLITTSTCAEPHGLHQQIAWPPGYLPCSCF
jgi:hypothetical protein